MLFSARKRAAALAASALEDREKRIDPRKITFEVAVYGSRRTHLQVFEDRHAWENAPAFGRLRNFHPHDFMGLQMRNIAALEDNSSFARLRSPTDGHHQRGFSSAVRADDRDDFSRHDIDVDAFQRNDAAVIGGNAFDR